MKKLSLGSSSSLPRARPVWPFTHCLLFSSLIQTVMIITLTFNCITSTTCLALQVSEISPSNTQLSRIPSVSLNDRQSELGQSTKTKMEEERKDRKREKEANEEDQSPSSMSHSQLFPLTFMHFDASTTTPTPTTTTTTLPSVEVTTQLSGMKSHYCVRKKERTFFLFLSFSLSLALSFTLTFDRSNVLLNRFSAISQGVLEVKVR